MKIARIEATPLAIPLAQEFHWAGGAQVGANLVLFSVHTDDGVVGYGESICEDPRRRRRHGELMARQLVGHSPGDMEAMLRAVWTEGRWKMLAAVHADRRRRASRSPAGTRSVGRSACRRARSSAARPATSSTTSASSRATTPSTLAAHARQLAGEGHRVIYLKVGRGARDDDACVAAVREAIGPEPLLRIDPNEAWDVATAVERIRRLEQYDLDWVEQPVPARDVAGLAHVRRSVEREDRRRPGRVHDAASCARCSRRRRPT